MISAEHPSFSTCFTVLFVFMEVIIVLMMGSSHNGCSETTNHKEKRETRPSEPFSTRNFNPLTCTFLSLMDLVSRARVDAI